MLFNSLEYAIFLIAVLVVYWALARTRALRIAFLLVASYVFYAASNPWFISLLAASTVTDYFAALGMDRARARERPGARKAWLILSLVLNLGLLAVFKYSNFFYESVVDLANLFGAGWTFERLDILLPAGISFYTFQTMSYSIDVYRGKLEPERSFLRFAFFVGYFPQLVAGPIVRAIDFLPQIPKPPFVSRLQAGRAFWLIGIGLFKKVVIADYLAVNLVDRVFDAPERFSSVEILLGLYAYTMQVYMDFSAYSDIAIGSALLMGFHLPDNFDRPYAATSIADFWRRWHMTLGSWLRDYLYYPLGGSRRGDGRAYLNLYITFLLIGLWHGARWTFVAYGFLHATAMCINRYFRVHVGGRDKTPHWGWAWLWRVALTLHFVVFARILFRSQSFGQAADVASALVSGGTHVTAMTPLLWGMLLGSFVVHWLPRRYVDGIGRTYERLPIVLQGALLAAAILMMMQVASADVVPFIYFQF
ncbi:MAG: MBOAT family protein [Deltaproteobacteria bacterium]|nr:MBOAT family protein [Deltaproteobacteria bacterium]